MFRKAVFVVLVAIGILWYLGEETFDEETLRGRNVLITGASSGIGEALAYQYARLGANVFITARREHLLKEVVEKCKKLGDNKGKYGYYVADMADYKKQSKILIQKAVDVLGGLDTVIINHVGHGQVFLWYGTQKELDAFDSVFEISFNSYVHIASHALPHLKKSHIGRMGVISSIAGKTGFAMASTYSAAKFAMDGFFSSARLELEQGRHNVTVTLAVLGYIATEGGAAAKEAAFSRLQMTEDDIEQMVTVPFTAEPADTALEIMKSTERGEAELYYPAWYRTLNMPIPNSLIPVIRHFCPKMVRDFILKEQYYRKYEKLILE